MKDTKKHKSCAFLGKAYNLTHYILSRKISIHATHTAYFMILSIFPLLVLFLSVLRYTGLEISTLTGALQGVLPDALMPAVEQIVRNTYVNSSMAVISISAVTALWSASRGVYGLITGLNSIYAVSENRGYLYTRTISVVYTFLFLVVLVLTLILHVFGTAILGMLPQSDLFLVKFLSNIIHSRFVSLFILQTLLFTTVFMVFPNQRNSLKSSFPGAILASLGWLIFTKLYSVYVSYATNYASIYGSVYLVALGMLWLYCCLFIVFSGGAFNQYLLHRKNPIHLENSADV